MSAEDKDKKPSDAASSLKPHAYVDSERDLGFAIPMLEKIRLLLTSTEPEKWRVGGVDLTSETKFERPRNTYEQVLVRDIPAGSLVLHCSQPVSSKYMPGGYVLTPLGPASYSVEVRDRIFDANKVVDPRYADNQKGKRCDVIASGEIAKSLFIQVRETIRNFSQDRKKTFTDKAREMLETLLERLSETTIEEWEKTRTQDKDVEDIRYLTEIEDIKVEIGRKIKEWQAEYRIVLSQGSFSFDHTSQSLAKTCFKKLEEMEQNAQLEALGQTLKELGFE